MSRRSLFIRCLYEAFATLISGHVLLLCTILVYPFSRLRSRLSAAKKLKTIAVIGSGDGVGRAISLQYASNDVNLILVDSIDQPSVISQCLQAGASVIPVTMYTNDMARMNPTLKAIDLEYHVDLIVICKYEDWYSHQPPVSVSAIGESIFQRNSQSIQAILKPLLQSSHPKQLLLVNSSSSQAFGISGSIEYAAAHASLLQFARNTNHACIVTLGSVESKLASEMSMNMEISTLLAAKLCKESVTRGIKFVAAPLTQSTALCFAGNLFSHARAKLSAILSTEFRLLRL